MRPYVSLRCVSSSPARRTTASRWSIGHRATPAPRAPRGELLVDLGVGERSKRTEALAGGGIQRLDWHALSLESSPISPESVELNIKGLLAIE